MGMDLIGFLVKGPVKLPGKDTKKVQKMVQRTKDGLNALAVLRSAAGDTPSDDHVQAMRDLCLRYRMDWEDQGDGGISYIDILLAIKAPTLYDDLLSVWHNGARDAYWRDDPDNRRIRWIFAGAGSWGDEPDGWGYRTLRDIIRLGWNEVLNIR